MKEKKKENASTRSYADQLRQDLNVYERPTPNQASQQFSEVSRENASMEEQLKELQAKSQRLQDVVHATPFDFVS